MSELFDYATTNPGSGGTNLVGDSFTQDSVAKFLPASYIVFGPADGPYTRVDASNGLPVAIVGSVAVSGPLTNAELRASPLEASIATLPLPTGAAADGSDITGSSMPAGGGGIRGWLSAIYAKLMGVLSITGTVAVSNLPATQPVSGTVAISNTGFAVVGAVEVTNDAGNPLPVSGTVTGDFYPATQPVSGTFWQTTQPVSIAGTVTTSGLTDAQIRATPLPVSGTFYQATQPVSIAGTVTTTALTDTQLRASAVPVSLASVPSHAVTNAGTFAVQATQVGTWNVGTLTSITNVVHIDDNSGSLTIDAPVASPAFVRLSNGVSAVDTLPVSGTFWQATQPVSIASLPALTAGSAVIGHVITDTGSTTAITGNVTIVQATGTNLHSVIDSGTITTVATVTNLAQLGGVAIAMGSGIRSTGTQRVTIATDDVVPVTGTFFQATQPVSLASLPALTAGSAVIGHVIIDTGSTTAVTGNVTIVQATGSNLHAVIDSGTITTVSTVTNLSQLGGVAVAMGSGVRSAGTQRVTVATDDVVPVTGAFFQATQPISAVSLPLPSGAAQDGTDITTPTAMPAGGVGIRGWLSAIWTKLNGTLAVSGTFWQATQPVSVASLPALTAGSAVIGHVIADTGSTTAVTGNVTIVQATGTNLHSVIDSGTITTVSTVTNLSQLGGVAIAMGSGVRSTGTQRVTISTDDVVPVTGTFWQATQPVSLAALPALVAGSAVIGHVIADTGSTTAVTGNVTIVQATGSNLHTVIDSGTVTTVSTVTNLSQLGGVAIAMGSGVRSSGTQRVTISTDDVVPVTGTFWQATQPVSLASLPALVAGSAVIGHVIADTGSTTAVTGNVTIVQATGTNLHMVVDSGTVTTVSTVTNLSQLGGNAIAMGSGVRSTGTQRVTIATDDVVPVTGTFWQATQPVSIAATVTVDSELPAAASLADGASNPTAPAVGAFGMLSNGTTWDKETGNLEGTALISAGRTTTTNSSAITNANAKGVLLFMDITVVGVGCTLIFMLQGKDPITGNWINLHATAATFNTVNTFGQAFSPGDAQAAGSSGVIGHYSGQLPRTWRVQVIHSNGNSCTYSVGYCLLV